MAAACKLQAMRMISYKLVLKQLYVTTVNVL
jgi:hypothetical protein